MSSTGGGAVAEGDRPTTKAEHVFDCFCSPLRAVAVAVGVDGVGHRPMGVRTGEQLIDFGRRDPDVPCISI
jgi:hypothetical protein